MACIGKEIVNLKNCQNCYIMCECHNKFDYYNLCIQYIDKSHELFIRMINGDRGIDINNFDMHELIASYYLMQSQLNYIEIWGSDSKYSCIRCGCEYILNDVVKEIDNFVIL